MSRGLLAVGLLLQAGCGALTGFSCLDDSQCRNGGRTGVCVTGYCAYPDSTCNSGLRWSAVAADGYADRCVETTGSTSDASMTDPSSSSSGEPSGSESSSTTMEPPIPFCGDGIVDAGEECDPADPDPEVEPCNTDCVFSGRLIDEFTWPHEGRDAAMAIALWDGDIAVAGYAEWAAEGEGLDIHVARHAPDGTLRWTPHRVSGTAHKDDYARGLAVSPEGQLRAVGHMIPEEGEVDADQSWMAAFDSEGMLRWEAVLGAAAVTDQATGLVILDEDDFIVVGRVSGASSDFSIHRYSFATGVITPIWEDTVSGPEMEVDLAYGVAKREDGFLFAGGFVRATMTDRDRYLSWWMFDGVAAPAPCDAGDHPRAPDAVDEIRGVAVRPDGSIAAVGIAQPGASQDAWVGVYKPNDCTLDWQRSVGGMADGTDQAIAVAVDPQGNILTAGWLRDGTNDDTWLVKWDGVAKGEVLWTALAVNGPDDGDDRIHAIAIDDDGSIVVAGQLSEPGGTDIWVARYTP